MTPCPGPPEWGCLLTQGAKTKHSAGNEPRRRQPPHLPQVPALRGSLQKCRIALGRRTTLSSSATWPDEGLLTPPENISG